MAAKPRKGTIESLVKRSIERGRSVLEIIGAAKAKYPRGRIDRIPEYLDRWYAATGRSPAIEKPPTISDRQRQKLITEGVSTNYKRVVVDFTWRNPKDDTREDRTYAIDIPKGLKGTELQNAIANKLIDILSGKYSESIKTQRDLAEFVISYNLRNG